MSLPNVSKVFSQPLLNAQLKSAVSSMPTEIKVANPAIVAPVLSTSANKISQTITQKVLKEEMCHHLATVAKVFAEHYAPLEWKSESNGLDLATSLAKAQDKVKKTKNIVLKDYHGILRSFIGDIGDYHVGIRFHSTASSTLPFSVVSSNDRFFISYIDNIWAPDFPFKVGDEIVTFNGKPVLEEVQELQDQMGKNVPATDRALAEKYLTSRSGRRGDVVPNGKVVIGVKRKGSNQIEDFKLNWKHKPEQLGYRNPEVRTRSLKQFDSSWPFLRNMVTAHWDPKMAKTENPTALGARKSFVPELGKVLWKSKPTRKLDAYIFETDDKKKIGYVRIPSYMGGPLELLEFLMLAYKFNRKTDALIIDQVNNPGGSVLYLNLFTSMLTDKPLYSPEHRISINHADVIKAIELLESPPGDVDIGIGFLQTLMERMKDQAAFIVEQWKKAQKDGEPKGSVLTEPYHLGMGTFIGPSPIRYEKPIMVLVNELDFSGGDFFPAILQDDERAKIFGTRTAGAGGFVKQKDCNPNTLGVDLFAYTGSLAKRLNDEFIESNGVTPDATYKITEKDLQNNYTGYKAAILKELKNLMETSPTKGEFEPAESLMPFDADIKLGMKTSAKFQQTKSMLDDVNKMYKILESLGNVNK